MLENLGSYRILDRIGAGRIGDVYRARDTRLGRTVAIKLLSPELQADEVRREALLADARRATALSHPNVATLYEVGHDEGHDFLVFEFVPGELLSAVMAGRPLNPRRAVDLAGQMADALADAHAENIVHRDIRPGNVIVTPKGNAKILDFGLDRWTAGGAERRAAANATTDEPSAGLSVAAYLSPEQAIGEVGDHRTDIFSLGVVLFEMLTGTLPFAGHTPAALAVEIARAPAAAPSAVNRTLPPDLDTIVAKALAKSVDQRYEAAATLAAELRSIVAVLDLRTAAAEPARVAPVRQERTLGPIWIVVMLVLLLAALAFYFYVGRATAS